jgi:1,2-dihydroxy-3-keto-5-methylthiopentene dioxygenase
MRSVRIWPAAASTTRVVPDAVVSSDVPADALLARLAAHRRLKARGGYVTADVIDVSRDTPASTACSRASIRSTGTTKTKSASSSKGRGLFHSASAGQPVFAIEVEAGDLIRVPRGTHHWFDLCGDRRIRAIRLFQDPSGWTPHYTQSGADRDFQPVCFGPAYIRPTVPAASL